MYTEFRKRVENRGSVRPLVDMPAQLKPLPRGLEEGDIPEYSGQGEVFSTVGSVTLQATNHVSVGELLTCICQGTAVSAHLVMKAKSYTDIHTLVEEVKNTDHFIVSRPHFINLRYCMAVCVHVLYCQRYNFFLTGLFVRLKETLVNIQFGYQYHFGSNNLEGKRAVCKCMYVTAKTIPGAAARIHVPGVKCFPLHVNR